MIKSLLIGLDGSKESYSALDLGLRWAKRFNAVVVGLGIIDQPGIATSGESLLGGAGVDYWRTPSPAKLLDKARHAVAAILEDFVQRCSVAGVECKTLEDVGSPYIRILIEAQRYDLVMLGQQTHFGNDSPFESDETLCKVLQDSPRPVVAVPAAFGGGESVVVAYDGSLQAARAVYAFEASGLGDSRTVHVVSVAKDRKDSVRHANSAIEFLHLHDIDATSHPLESSASTAEVILSQVHDLDAGLLVMGAYGQPVLQEFFLGSVTRTVLNKSPVPVFCQH